MWGSAEVSNVASLNESVRRRIGNMRELLGELSEHIGIRRCSS
jgi:hypothetical protein